MTKHTVFTAQSRLAFTLVELLVVVAIIGLLVSLLLPAVQAVRESGRQATCKNNLKQLALSALHYESAHGKFPPGYLGDRGGQVMQPGLHSYIGHLVFLMPHLELEAIHAQWNAKRRFDIENPSSVASGDPLYQRWVLGVSSLWNEHQNRINIFLCPSDDAYMNKVNTVTELRTSATTGVVHGFNEQTLLGRTNYLGSAGRLGIGVPNREPFKGVFYARSKTRIAEVTDGTSNTMLFGEVTGGFTDPKLGIERRTSLSWNAGPQWTEWHRPVYGYQGQKRVERFSSMHPGIVYFARVDGSVVGMSNFEENLVSFSAMSDGAVEEVQ